MIESRITSKAQTTIPRAVRSALGLGEGDQLVWLVEGSRVVLSRALASSEALENSFATFTEWADPLDSAYDNL